MDDSHLTSRRRSRRARWWAGFGLAGVLMGTVYASGYATSDSTVDGTNAGASNVFGTPANAPQSASPYQGTLTNPSDLAVTFNGLWGVIAADHVVFEVNLSSYSGQTFYVDILVNNSPTGWTTAQLKWLQFTCPDTDVSGSGANDLTSADFDTQYAVAASNTAGQPKLMNVTTTDSHVSFPSLAGGSRYCFGIKDMAQADDDTGTILVRPQLSVAPTTPTFTAIVNRSA